MCREKMSTLEPLFTTKGEDGTGLGLAMVHRVVKKYDGSIEIESEQSTGTTVELRLPLGNGEVALAG